ncbi:3-hydroxybutyryl-CoA dehydrogenase [Sphingobium sp. YR768]|nr:3-hydroxybutyryl-CoA dehydrogenase [Sphingobium sp. YR768]
MSRTMKTVAVCGAGAMGSGIAQVAAQAGASVVVYDTNHAALEAGGKRVADALASLVARKKLDAADAAAVASRIRWTDRLEDMSEVELTVEAIIEREDIKAELFAALEGIVADDAVIATNTSSLPISRLADGLRRPERFVGMHFFNPAPVMKLVEVVAGRRTSTDVSAAVVATASAWGKVAVPVADVAGFIVNRVARPFYAEAFLALEEKVASAELIDHLFRSSAGFRMGPLELTDLIGQDVNYSVARSIFDAYEGRTRFTPQRGQAALVDAGRLGRKTKGGVYCYAESAAPAEAPAPTKVADPSGLPIVREGRAAFARLLDGLHGRAPRGLVGVGDALVGFSNGRSAASEAASAGRDVALFDWFTADAGAALGFSASSDSASAAAVALANAVDRTVFRIEDRPGLIILRTIAMLVNAAADAALDDVADEGGIDAAMRFGANYPFGLFAWAQDFGRDRVAEVLANIATETDDAMYEPSVYLKVAAR